MTLPAQTVLREVAALDAHLGVDEGTPGVVEIVRFKGSPQEVFLTVTDHTTPESESETTVVLSLSEAHDLLRALQEVLA